MKCVASLIILAIFSGIKTVTSRPSEDKLNQLGNDDHETIEINGEIYVKRKVRDPIKHDALREEGMKEVKREEEQKDLLELQEKEEERESKDGGEKVVEGDILVSPYIESLRNGKDKESKRNILKDTGKWPNQKYYYQLASSLTSSMRAEVKKAIKIMGQVSCIEFIEQKHPQGYVIFQNSTDGGCNSYVGKTHEQPQTINVALWCNSGGIQHEILHSLGFLHEQSRPDRDNYVTIKWDNIKEGATDQFKKYEHPIVETYKEPYDYKSIMHYSRMAFSKNGKDTIEPKAWFVSGMGHKSYLSDSDKTLLNRYYGCVPCKNTGWFCSIRAKTTDSCERGKSKCLGSCGMYCKP